jgi:hypothetical protein
MISWDCWMVKNIIKQKSQLNKQVRATNDKDTDVSNKMCVFLEALIPLEYTMADLKEVA